MFALASQLYRPLFPVSVRWFVALLAFRLCPFTVHCSLVRPYTMYRLIVPYYRQQFGTTSTRLTVHLPPPRPVTVYCLFFAVYVLSVALFVRGSWSFVAERGSIAAAGTETGMGIGMPGTGTVGT
ncbi:hypothetical protein HOY80DRAFT_970485 [Tuber brumale]|nr:hypothetical protein HOY80DRAFT_970485 [Tuber brumale]